MKTLLPLVFALLFAFCVKGQTPSRTHIKGIVKSNSGTELVGATVMLLEPKDSTLVNFGRVDEKGAFEFRSVKNTSYIFKISYVGYLPYQQSLSPSANGITDLGLITIKPLAKELIEVVIKAARAPLTIKGDTVEYNASSFKVPPGSTVEDLLRRLPGMNVDANGKIKAQGQDVKKVLVDGKSFFGDDPKAAIKNLGAETISKVQVYNDKSEQAKLTGIDDGKKEKAINLELKEEFKKGAFGKVTLAGGTESRMAARGNYNRFNKKEQFSIIGYGNNINETGVNWEDYGEFKGNNSFNEYDNGDFGFSSGGGMQFFSMSDGIMNSFDGKGFTKNFGSGINYNYDHAKTKLSTSYFYNQTRLSLDQFTNKKTFLENNYFTNTDTLGKSDYRRNHSFSVRWEEKIDSLNTLVAKANVRLSGSTVNTLQNQRYLTDQNVLNTLSNINNGSKLNSYTLGTTVIYGHKFKKKGRSFSLSGGFNASSSDGTEDLNSLSRFLNATNVNEQVKALGQLNQTNNKSNQLKSSAYYTEPLSKRIFWETFYNFSRNVQDVDREATDKLQNNQPIAALSIYFKNTVLYNRIGTGLRYSYQGINFSAGLAAQRYDLNGKQSPGKNLPISQEISKQYNALTPNFSTSIDFKHNTYLSFDYSYNVQAPDMNALQPVVNNSNPFYITVGNPELAPEKSHNLNLSFNKFDPASFSYLNAWMGYSYNTSQIIYNQTVDANYVTTVRPENLSGGKSFRTGIYAGIPIVKTKLTLNVNGSVDLSKSPTFINGIKNETDGRNYSVGLGLNATLSDKLLMNVGGKLGFNNISYSIEERQNQKIRNNGMDASVKWNFAPKFFFETNFDYSSYKNDRFGFNRDIPIFNASVRRLLTKDNKIEVRLAAFDIFNKKQSIIQDASQNYVSQQVSPTLARYFMLSVTYNIKGITDKLSKRGGEMF